MGQNTRLGQGCIVCNDVNVSCDALVGDFVTFQRLANIGHDVHIGNYSHLGTSSFMGGFSQLGEQTTVQTSGIVLPHVRVGDGCLVGAGAVVIKDVRSGQTVFGNPAKVLKF